MEGCGGGSKMLADGDITLRGGEENNILADGDITWKGGGEKHWAKGDITWKGVEGEVKCWRMEI